VDGEQVPAPASLAESSGTPKVAPVEPVLPRSQPVLSVPDFFLVLVSIFVLAKLLGELAERLGQPAVLGELLAGVLLGASLLGLVDPGHEIVHLLAELGVVLLLFEIGLETDLRRLLAVGSVALTVAAVGVAVPFALGVLVARSLGADTLASLVVGAALTATSVGITARVLSDLGRLNDPEGQVVLGAAILDDVMGLIILAVVSSIVAGDGVGPMQVARATGAAFGFLALALIFGRLLAPGLFGVLARLGREQTVAMMGVAFALLLSLAALRAGSALIVGAFAAGVVLAKTSQAETIRVGAVRIGYFFVPIFFVSVGAAVDVRALGQPEVLLLGSALLAVGIVGKVVAGFAPWWFRGRKLVVGVGMVPRGEVGLIFAQMGLAAGALNAGQYAALMLMVMGTTFAAPPALRLLFKDTPTQPPPGEVGVAELLNEA
jgi:Kef-type K+ transport system membrane component KefB